MLLWQEGLPRLKQTKWRSSKYTPVHFAIPTDRFRGVNLVLAEGRLTLGAEIESSIENNITTYGRVEE